MKFRLFIFSLLFISLSFAQNTVNVCLGTDATVCQGKTVNLTNCSNVISPNPNAIVLDNPTTVSFGSFADDRWSGVVPIGFNFNFFGNTYSNCIIGSNGIIGFETSKANTACAWSLSGVNSFPSTNAPTALNTFMGCYQDIHPGLNNAVVQYQTIGTAPNRKFIVLYSNVYFFSCTNVCNYFSMVLYEGTNELESHIGNKPVCSSFNGGLAAQGVMNAAGNTAYMTTGRNITVWTANQDARRFTPTSPANTSAYTISQIPYQIVTGSNGSIEWIGTNGTHYPYNNGTLTLTSVPSGTTGYYLAGSACGASIGSVSDTTWLTSDVLTGSLSFTPDYCSAGTGTATINMTSTGPFTYLWMPSNQTTQTATGLSAGNQTLTVTNANGCNKTYIASINNTSITLSSTTTPVSCPGGNDGTATVSVLPVAATNVFDWYDANNQTTATATGLAAGTYHCKVTAQNGCTDTIAVTITEIPAMVVTTTTQTDVQCYAGADGKATLNVINGTAPYTYSWANSVATSNSALDLSVGNTVVTIKDAKNCEVTHTVTLGQPDSLYVAFITPNATICPEDSTTITANGGGGNSAYIYNWFSNGVPIGNTQTITVNPLDSNTIYTVRLSEVCGSPVAHDSMAIYFPIKLTPLVAPNYAKLCQPGLFSFENTTDNLSEIASTYFDFGNGLDSLVLGSGGAQSAYPNPGKYTVNLIMTSIHGCVYTNTLTNIVETMKNPTASFTASANPTTIFETNVLLANNSTSDVVDWEWSAPGANPSTSSVEDPTFYFPEGEPADYPVTLVVTTSLGCVDTFTSVIHVVNDITFYAPNAFTPDGNEHNQTWKLFIDGIDRYNFSLILFNRWGQVVWETKDPSAEWDGTFNGELVQDGTYTWKAQVKNALNDEVRMYHGFVSVIR